MTRHNFPSSLVGDVRLRRGQQPDQQDRPQGPDHQYVYDALNRLTSKTYPDTTAWTTSTTWWARYAGERSDRNVRLRLRQHGAADRDHHQLQLPDGRNFTNAYTYDAASNRTGFTDPEGGIDDLRLRHAEPAHVTGATLGIRRGSFGFSYDALSRRTQMTRPNSVDDELHLRQPVAAAQRAAPTVRENH